MVEPPIQQGVPDGQSGEPRFLLLLRFCPLVLLLVHVIMSSFHHSFMLVLVVGKGTLLVGWGPWLSIPSGVASTRSPRIS
jgi:hypothetical protein